MFLLECYLFLLFKFAYNKYFARKYVRKQTKGASMGCTRFSKDCMDTVWIHRHKSQKSLLECHLPSPLVGNPGPGEINECSSLSGSCYSNKDRWAGLMQETQIHLEFYSFPLEKKTPELSRKTNAFIQHSAPGNNYSSTTIPRVICEPGPSGRLTVQGQKPLGILPSSRLLQTIRPLLGVAGNLSQEIRTC